jgi:hypothetical protein
MSKVIPLMKMKIPEACTELCFGDVIRMSTEEKKCLTNCFEQHRDLTPTLLKSRKEDRNLIF